MDRGSSMGRRALPYVVALVGVAMTQLARRLLDPIIGRDTPFVVLYFLPVIIAAWRGGYGPAFVAAVLGLALGDLVSFDPDNGIPFAARFVRVATFLFEAGFVAWLFESRRGEERARRESQSRYRALAENYPGGAVFVLDTELRYQLAAGLGLAEIGLEPSDFVGKTPSDVLEPEVAAQLLPSLRAALEGKHETMELEYRGRAILQRAAPLSDDRGRVVGVLLVGQDVTDQKQLERDLRETQKLDAVGKLAGGVAHDFNNLLSVVVTSVDALSASRPSDGQRRWIRAIDDAAKRAVELTRQLVAFSRRQALEAEVTDLNELVEAMHPLLASMLPGRVELALDLAPSIAPVSVNRTEAERAIMNLCVNARDAMPDGGRLTIRTRMRELPRSPESELAESEVELSVVDDGIGMDDVTRGQVETGFFTTKGRSGGSGLGVSVVRSFVGRSQGRLEIESVVGKGSAFRIVLPVAARTSDITEMRSLIRPVPTARLRVMVVDDEDSIRSVMVQFLRARGYEVAEAVDAETALAEFAPETDVLVTDVVLPGISGIELARTLRAQHPGLRIVLASGADDVTTILDSAAGMGADFLAKPFRLSELFATIEGKSAGGARVAHSMRPQATGSTTAER